MHDGRMNRTLPTARYELNAIINVCTMFAL